MKIRYDDPDMEKPTLFGIPIVENPDLKSPDIVLCSRVITRYRIEFVSRDGDGTFRFQVVDEPVDIPGRSD